MKINRDKSIPFTKQAYIDKHGRVVEFNDDDGSMINRTRVSFSLETEPQSSARSEKR